jgi:hypothetical protein
VALVVAPVSTGCDSVREALTGQSQALCDQSVDTVRQAIGFGDFEAARKWRDYTWKACAERGVVATLDKELLAAEEARLAEQAKAKQGRAAAQKRINQANVLWQAFDRDPKRSGDAAALEEARASAERLARGLDSPYAEQVRAFNDAEHKKRLAAQAR